MAKNLEVYDRRSFKRLAVLVLVVALVLGAWLFWQHVYESEQNVFWGMIENNLSSGNVTRHVTQKSSTQELDQYIELQFGAVNASHSLVNLKQVGALSTAVESETIGTTTSDFSRYLSISTEQKNSDNKPIDTSNLIGVWAKADQSSGAGQYFSQNILSIVPFGSFNAKTRNSLVKFIKSHQVYQLMPGTKKDKFEGHAAYVYQVNVSPLSYVETMAEYAKDLGLPRLGLDPSQYATSPPISVELTVDKLSRRLLEANFISNGQQETYVSQGLEQPITPPGKTISLSELQKRIQSSLQ